MKFIELYNLLTDSYSDETPKVSISDLIIRGQKLDGKSIKIEFSNGAYTNGVIRKWFNPKTFEEKDYSIGIVSWGATPMSSIMDRGLIAQKDYKGRGFASKCFNELLKIAKQNNIDIFTIFAPSDDSQAVMKNYTDKNVLIPIESSKAAYGDFYTEFRINWSEANKRLN